MTTTEKLERKGWVYLTNFAQLEIFGRLDNRLLYDPRTDSIYRIYTVNKDNQIINDLRVPTDLDLLDIFYNGKEYKDEKERLFPSGECTSHTTQK